MTEPKWTKGPWFSNDDIQSAGDATRFVMVVDGSEDAVARVMAYGRRKGTKTDDEFQANAALIAAAPDLYAGSDQDRIDLEALRSEITGGDCRWPPMALVLVDGILVSIERRLARARGEG